MKYRIGKSNKTALLFVPTGKEVANFESEYLANRCVELLNQQYYCDLFKNYQGVMAYYIKEERDWFVISDYKGDKVANTNNEFIASRIQKLLSYNIISKLSVKEIQKVTTVKAKFRIKTTTEINGEKTYSLYKDNLFAKIPILVVMFCSIIIYVVAFYLKDVFFMVISAILLVLQLVFYNNRFEEQIIPKESTTDTIKLSEHIEMLKQRIIKKQLKKLLLRKTTTKEVEL